MRATSLILATARSRDGRGPLERPDRVRQALFDRSSSESWDQIRTPRDLYTMYYEPRLEALLRKVNATLFNLVNTTNFSIHSSITGGSDVFTRANLGTAWSNLTGYGVPTAQPGMMAFITHPTVYANMTSTTDFYQESVVGINTAEQVQQKAMLAPAYNTSIIYDQHFTATSGATGVDVPPLRDCGGLGQPALGG